MISINEHDDQHKVTTEVARTPARPLPSASDQAKFMELALAEAGKCTPTPSAFCVGAVLVSASDGSYQLLSTGYSRELEGNTHAEACAIDKLEDVDQLKDADIYTTMEPCSVRLSGNTTCCERLLAVGVKRVFLGTREPDEFVVCEGIAKLRQAGVEVITVAGFEERCLEAARRGR